MWLLKLSHSFSSCVSFFPYVSSAPYFPPRTSNLDNSQDIFWITQSLSSLWHCQHLQELISGHSKYFIGHFLKKNHFWSICVAYATYFAYAKYVAYAILVIYITHVTYAIHVLSICNTCCICKVCCICTTFHICNTYMSQMNHMYAAYATLVAYEGGLSTSNSLRNISNSRNYYHLS